MSALRHAHRLASFVLMWFVLSLSVAVASPVVHPQAVELVCSASGAVKADADRVTALVAQCDDTPR